MRDVVTQTKPVLPYSCLCSRPAALLFPARAAFGNIQLPGPSLLERDLMAVLGAPSTSTTTQQQQQQQMNSFGSSATAGVAMSGVGAGMPRSRSGPTPGPSSTSVPLLQPPTRDTPSYNRTAYNGVPAVQQQQQQQQPEAAIVLHGGGGHQHVPSGSMVVHGGMAGGQGSGVANGGFNQVRCLETAPMRDDSCSSLRWRRH